MADGPSRMSFPLLESITNNFSEDRVLGSGAYGKVYLGEQEDGQKIAIKILHDMPGHDDVQFEKEFYNLANLQHQNIVRLVGFCHETRRELWPHNGTMVLANVTEKALCFEFMENGSLEKWLYDESNGYSWRTRYTIIKGVCNGLKYLHEELKPPIFHLDLKPTNILLDKNMNPKIADFGLSRFFKEENSHITKSPIGTFGYLPPEFINEKLISKKLDIFSLGVVIIKIMAGPEGRSRSAEMSSDKFIQNVHGNWRNRLQSVASGDLLESYSEQVKRCIVIALSCVVDDRQKRPTIGDIVNMLTDTETPENYHGALIDQMSTCIVKDSDFVDVHPLQLHFSFRPNKFMSCPFHVTNNMNYNHVSVRCVPKHEEATSHYYARMSRIVGVVPPRSTHTFVVMMKPVEQPPANMDVLDMVVESVLGEVPSSDDSFETHFKDARKENSCGFHEVTLKAVCATTSKTTTSEVMLHNGNYSTLCSMDVHPTEPWILAVYPCWLVIWNYKTQTRIKQCEPYFWTAIPNFLSFHVAVRVVRFIEKSTEQLFVVGDCDGYIHVHDCMTMKRVKKFKAHGDGVTSFAVHPTQPFVLSASWDNLIKLWDYEKGWVCIRTFTGHSSWVNQVKFNPHDVSTFASASRDGTVKIWRIFSSTHFTSLDCEERQTSVDYRSRSLTSVDYYPTGGEQQHYMVTGSEDGTSRIWDLRTQTCIHEIKGPRTLELTCLKLTPCEVGVIDCHPDRPAVLVTTHNSGVSLHDSTTYRCEGTVHFGLGDVLCFSYIKGTRSLAIAHREGIAIMEIDEFYKNVLPPAR